MVLQPLSFLELSVLTWGSPVSTSINSPGACCRGTSSSGDDLYNFIIYTRYILKRTYKGIKWLQPPFSQQLNLHLQLFVKIVWCWRIQEAGKRCVPLRLDPVYQSVSILVSVYRDTAYLSIPQKNHCGYLRYIACAFSNRNTLEKTWNSQFLLFLHKFLHRPPKVELLVLLCIMPQDILHLDS